MNTKIEDATPLLIVGNKRSGTSLLVELLNLHEEVFISYESDVVWILYQKSETRHRQGIVAHARDGGVGLRGTLEVCHEMVAKIPEKSVREVFFEIQLYLMRTGSSIQRPQPEKRKPLQWVGDKKPVQHTDPKVRPFINKHFPDACFLHIIRDPRACVASKQRAAKHWTIGVPKYWRDKPGHIMHQWVIHEQEVMEIAKSKPVHSLRLESLCADPENEIHDIFSFLGLKVPEKSKVDLFIRQLRRDPNKRYRPLKQQLSPIARSIMTHYGYP